MSEDRLKVEVAMCVRILEYLGLIDYSGHVSCRIPGTDTIFMNPWGGSASPEKVRPQDIVKSDLGGNPLVAGVKLPSEINIHTSIYRFRPDINAVAHLHPPVTTALSAAGKEYVPVMHHGAIFHEGVSVYDDCRHVNTVEKGDALAATLGKLRATIIRGHGAVVVAESVKGVFFGSVYLEDNAKKLADAYNMGGKPQVLRAEEIEACKRIWRQDQFDKVWNYYQEKSGITFD
ncbi:class II aldolase/adducin family protein [Thermodesulfobacteriota bacterium]